MKKLSSEKAGYARFGGAGTPGGFLFELTGGRLCLDLANTLDERKTDHPVELLRHYSDVLRWGVQSGVLAQNEADALRAHADRHPKAADNALRRVIALRETIFEIFSAIAARRSVPASALERLNRLLSGVFELRRLEVRDGRIAWTWRFGARPDLDRVYWRVVWSAAELLASADNDRVRQCEGSGCGWLFLDTSKNRTRRWCDMSVCGNRAKARRHYARTKSSQKP